MQRGSFRPTVIDLFCGCGGLSLGYKQAGFDILLAADNDDTALLTHKKNIPEAAALNLDLSTRSSIRKIRRAVSSTQLDVIVAGPPCQGFSLTGPRNLNDKRNNLILATANFIKELMPKAFLIENVPGLAILYGGKFKDDLCRMLESLGYNVSCAVKSLAHYGLPQTRRRLILVGLIKELGEFRFPNYTHRPEDFVSCADAISDLPSRKHELGFEEDEYEREPINPYQKKMRNSCRKLYNHVATNHTDLVKSVIAMVPEGGNYKDLPPGIGESRKFNEAWTRYHSKKPSRTIDTGHRNHFHYKYNRIPTVRENARLQSFPDWFRLSGNKTQQNRQVGNAVPPLFAYVLARHMKKYIAVGRSGPMPTTRPELNMRGLIEVHLVRKT